MIRLTGGTFLMGSDDFYEEEAPVREVCVGPFSIDAHPVTVADFQRFVRATGHRTVAEQTPEPAAYPDADPELLVPGSLVFRQTEGPVDLRDARNWWAYVPGAEWRNPEGPGSSIRDRQQHPVTQVAYADAEAYAIWAGKALPTEVEWEFAARGGREQARFTWGDEFAPKGKMMANTWQGEFPWQNLLDDGFLGTSPVKTFPPNGYGLYDMAGNVWEWTVDPWEMITSSEHACCAPDAARTMEEGASRVSADLPRKVIKGGSHLCAPNYCLRYRPAARQSETIDTSTVHLGFRCVVRD
ncbi:MAG TPA: formylglycine-generating enzyme family protein [Actinomycetota bacterium]|nr:formylglycine-generating enzyme family protein [Actinomycetota bacterium]